MNKIHHVRQHDSMECGISCLSMVCKIFDREYNTSELYKICKATKERCLTKSHHRNSSNNRTCFCLSPNFCKRVNDS